MTLLFPDEKKYPWLLGKLRTSRHEQARMVYFGWSLWGCLEVQDSSSKSGPNLDDERQFRPEKRVDPRTHFYSLGPFSADGVQANHP